MLARRSLLRSAAGIAALAAATTKAQAVQTAAPASAWDKVEFTDRDGQAFRLSDLTAPLKLIKLWAGWCPACLVEMDGLRQTANLIGPANMTVLLVSNPEDWRRDQLVAERHKLPFPLATLSSANSPPMVRSALLDRSGAYVVPRTLLFEGAQNTLVSERLGSADWAGQAAQLKARVR